ncbi:MAG TPA: ABC transporter permease [Candidatus Dormibacteraeota bacterium]|nr:ABC transporter permease [Candidatus Dormibacteraeota bacterium]
MTLEVGALVQLATRRPARPSRRWQPSRWRRALAPLVLLAIWAIGSTSGLIPVRYFPSLWSVGATTLALIQSGQLQENLLSSLGRVATGLGLGIGVGGGLALVAGLTRLGGDVVDPVMQMLRTLPALALVPMFVVWFGIGETAKVAMIAFATAFPVYLNLHAGILGADHKLIEAARTLELSRWQLIRRVVLPGAMASLLVGLRYAMGVAWLVLVVCEQINATTGIGAMMQNAEDFLRTDIIVVGLVLYALLGLASDALVRFLERRALAWRES